MTPGPSLFSVRKLLSVLLLCLISSSSAPETSFGETGPAASEQQTGKPAQPDKIYKGIFEPVNYPQDINLTDVFFTSENEGWVAGDRATVLHTSDRGTTWVAQLGGNSTGSGHSIRSLRFLDGKHGWAIEDDPQRLLRTEDGKNWEEINGKFPPGTPVLDYAFTSVSHGILLGGNGDAFYVSNDGGVHWRQVGPCQLTATVQGLAQTKTCHFIKLQMLSDRLGFALARWSSPEDPNADSIVVFRTEDAGEHWSSVVSALRDCCGADSFFTDNNHAVILFNNGKTYVTSDGGKSWRGLLSGRIELTSGGQSPALRFADPEVGWALGHSPSNRDAYRICFSIDGGLHWKASRDIPFPGGVLADLKFAFPRRDRAYVIGPHGMIYRYRVVPANYTGARVLEGPLMSAAGRIEEQP